jgi:hypothetical protein
VRLAADRMRPGVDTSQKAWVKMSSNSFIAMVVMILILLFILMAVGPLISAF